MAVLEAIVSGVAGGAAEIAEEKRSIRPSKDVVATDLGTRSKIHLRASREYRRKGIVGANS